MVWVALYTILGFYLLIYGGNVVCKNANIVALKANVSQFVIGMTLVAFSTSLPELFTSWFAVARGKCDMVINNVLGSNFINIGLAGGLVAMIRPFYVDKSVYKRDIPFLIFLISILNIFCFTPSIQTINGIVFLIFGSIYTYYIVSVKQRDNEDKYILNEISEEELNISMRDAINNVFAGILTLIIGSNLVISGCCNVARYLKVSNALVSFTLLAFGTSLPEITTSLIASLRNLGGICAGNIVGSNIFNLWMIVGSSAILKDLPSTAQLKYCDLPISIGYTAILGGFLYYSRILTRIHGFCLLLIFVVIVICLTKLHLI